MDVHADPFAALEGLSHPVTGAVPAAGGVDLDALYGATPAMQPTPAPLGSGGGSDPFRALQTQQQQLPTQGPFADPFAPPPSYQATTNMLGATLLLTTAEAPEQSQ